MVDQLSHEITFIGDVVITWEDWRLRFNGTKDGGCTDHLQFRDSSTLWAPDLFFERAVSVQMGGAGFGEIVTVNSEGQVVWTRESTVTVKCDMYFGNLPFDVQSCPFAVSLYSDAFGATVLRWADPGSPFSGWQRLRPMEWAITNVSVGVDLDATAEAEQEGSAISSAVAVVAMSRIARRYFTSYVMPSIFFVLIVYGGFFLGDDVPGRATARISLATITLLTHLSLENSARSQLPAFAYPSWLMSFMFGCFLFHMVAFCETIAVLAATALDERCRKAEQAGQRAEHKGDADGRRQSEAVDLELIQGSETHKLPPRYHALRRRASHALRPLRFLDATMRWLYLGAYVVFLGTMHASVGTYTALSFTAT